MIQDNLLHSILTRRALSKKEISGLLIAAEKDTAGQNLLESYLLVCKKRQVQDEEIKALIDLLLKRSRAIRVRTSFIDVCGTGGDQSHTFNISTTTAFVTAAGGVAVLKHGNRSVSSRCGSSDLLEAAGVSLARAAQKSLMTLKKFRFGYLHAPLFHPFFGKIAPLRKRIGQPTVFNFLGPLLHPARPMRQLVGVGDPDAFSRYGEWLKRSGRTRALVVRGEGGLDEALPYGTTEVLELKKGRVRKNKIRARDLGFKARKLQELTVEGPKENLSVFRRILSGQERGPKREAVLINAGLAFCLVDRVSNLREGIRFAAEVIDSGAANRLFAEYKRAAQ